MNLRALDLNLLVILDALLDEAHVSRAADRLHLTQPAVSNALQRCRAVFADELLERGRGSMRRTARAEALRAPLKTLLSDVMALVDPPHVPLASIRQTIKICMADYPAIFVIKPLLQVLAADAPGIDIVVQPWHGAAAAKEALVSGASDLALSVFPDADDDLQRKHLLDETYRVVMRRDHPAARGFTLDHWLAYPHILVSGRGDTNSPADKILAEKGLKRRIGLVVPNFGMVPDLLKSTDMIAMLPSHCVLDADSDLVAFPPPITVSGFPLHIAWHKRRQEDQALRYIVAQLSAILTEQ
ncbi:MULTISPECIES: LysR substrate-binding domain-containing protein [Brucella]|uniref:Miscellaneous Not classified regulator n=1 Tax=Ochrobactrum soli TaxID=2448455 RepID=A0A2P9HQC9_9HYPH|nr:MULTISPECIES: LysR substrate-binding domain-containing protein [Brucella]MCI0999953.1 LysR family transcriptional regulator [Ochrobactrum sp. C6C9]RRD24238.1 LysR family transcriptional regulator [Brucellaceae bacterium VT-16-1752]WHT41797.1 LysR substrate-binding domain-containing protein [Ochrobactrum sp. SSR]MDX4073539.1 LysR substrate-binding domain-containing protein [Brucella sp. NBRC 113783]WHS31729.1 LysR substrate-binding domain-containing protein [Brucella sp. NM4]